MNAVTPRIFIGLDVGNRATISLCRKSGATFGGIGESGNGRIGLTLMDENGVPAVALGIVHRQCAEQHLEQLRARGEMPFSPHTETWSPADLIGRYRDVTHCDHCGAEFQPADEGYIAYWVISQEDFRLWQEVRRESAAE